MTLHNWAPLQNDSSSPFLVSLDKGDESAASKSEDVNRLPQRFNHRVRLKTKLQSPPLLTKEASSLEKGLSFI